MVKKCECCGIELNVVMSSTIFCNKCSLYTTKLRGKISNLKIQVKNLRIKLYGIADGKQRLR